MAVAAVRLYSDLCKAPDDEVKARLIAEAFEEMEHRYPEVKDLATQSALRESELRLLAEIEKVRKEIKEMEGRLQLEIEKVRQEVKDTEGRLQLEIEKVRHEIKEVEVRLITAMHRQTIWVISAIGAILGILKFLDLLLK